MTVWKERLHAASKAPTIVGTAMAASFAPLLRPPPLLGVLAATLGVAVILVLLPKGVPAAKSKVAFVRVTIDG